MKTFYAALFVTAALLLVGIVEKQGDPLSGRMPRAEVAEVALPLQHPLDCDAIVTQRTYYHERGKTRCYSKWSQ